MLCLHTRSTEMKTLSHLIDQWKNKETRKLTYDVELTSWFTTLNMDLWLGACIGTYLQPRFISGARVSLCTGPWIHCSN